MIISFIKYVQGYVRLIVTGHSPERFLNLCSNRDFLIWDLKPETEGYEFKISKRAYLELEPLLEKTGTKIEVKDKIGLPFFLHRYRKRKIFALGILLCIGMVYAMTLFVWDIHVVGAFTYSKEEVAKYIEENYVKPGSLKQTIDCAVMESELREHYDKIAWISCELEGTRLTISMKESLKQNEEVESDEPCDIIARKDGIIQSIMTRNGTPMVKQSDPVKKGDVLISGTVYIYDESQTVLETDYVGAKGDIMAKTSYPYENSFPMSYYEKEYTGNQKTYLAIQTFQKHFVPYQPKIPYASYDTIQEVKQVKLGHTYYLPLSVTIYKAMEYKPVRRTYTEAQAKKKAEELLLKYNQELSEKGVEITKNNVKIFIADGVLTAKGIIDVTEPIGKPRLITIKNGDTIQ